MNESNSITNTHVIKPEPQPEPETPEWTYNHHRATLNFKGRFFAIVSNNWITSLNESEQKTLLDALNKPSVLTECLECGCKQLDCPNCGKQYQRTENKDHE